MTDPVDRRPAASPRRVARWLRWLPIQINTFQPDETNKQRKMIGDAMIRLLGDSTLLADVIHGGGALRISISNVRLCSDHHDLASSHHYRSAASRNDLISIKSRFLRTAIVYEGKSAPDRLIYGGLASFLRAMWPSLAALIGPCSNIAVVATTAYST